MLPVDTLLIIQMQSKKHNCNIIAKRFVILNIKLSMFQNNQYKGKYQHYLTDLNSKLFYLHYSVIRRYEVCENIQISSCENQGKEYLTFARNTYTYKHKL